MKQSLAIALAALVAIAGFYSFSHQPISEYQ